MSIKKLFNNFIINFFGRAKFGFVTCPILDLSPEKKHLNHNEEVGLEMISFEDQTMFPKERLKRA